MADFLSVASVASGSVREASRRLPSMLLVTDPSRSVLAARSGGIRHNSYSAHGFRAMASAIGLIGFNGEFQECHGGYLLGSYRVYRPLLMRFYSPDSLSPFGKGGLNAYAYCLGDPVNHRDPTGHLSWWNWVALGLALPSFGGAAVALAVGAASTPVQIAGLVSVADLFTQVAVFSMPKGKARDALGWAGMALGVVATTAGVTGLARHLAPGMYERIARRLPYWSRSAGRRSSTAVTGDGTEMVARRRVSATFDPANDLPPDYESAMRGRKPFFAETPPPSYSKATSKPVMATGDVRSTHL